MRIEVNDDLFSDLAKRLETTPENIVRVFLNHAQNLPNSVILNAVQKTSSLDFALEKLMNNAESAYLMDEIIREIIGEHEYSLDDSGYDLEDGTFWVSIDFPASDKSELESIHLQFGSNAVITGTFSIKDTSVEKTNKKLMAKIESIVENISDDERTTCDIQWIEENWASITISIYSDNILDLPKIGILEEIAKKIKSTFQKFDERNKLDYKNKI